MSERGLEIKLERTESLLIDEIEQLKKVPLGLKRRAFQIPKKRLEQYQESKLQLEILQDTPETKRSENTLSIVKNFFLSNQSIIDGYELIAKLTLDRNAIRESFDDTYLNLIEHFEKGIKILSEVPLYEQIQEQRDEKIAEELSRDFYALKTGLLTKMAQFDAMVRAYSSESTVDEWLRFYHFYRAKLDNISVMVSSRHLHSV